MVERLRVRIPAGAAGKFSSAESTLCAGSYSVSITPHVTAVARKRPRSFCQTCRCQVTPKQAYTFDPTKSEWTDYAAVQAWCGNLSRNQLACNLLGNVWPQLSQLTEPLSIDSGIKSGISMWELISTLKKEKKQKCRQEKNR